MCSIGRCRNAEGGTRCTERHARRMVGASARPGEAESDKLHPAYSVKYASALRAVREAAKGAKFAIAGTHQMDSGNRREALREAEVTWKKADMLMVTPALAYLDVIPCALASIPPVAATRRGEYPCQGRGGERVARERAAGGDADRHKRAGGLIITTTQGPAQG